MRLIGHLDSDKDARTFGDFLYVQGIENEAERELGWHSQGFHTGLDRVLGWALARYAPTQARAVAAE